MEMVSASKMRKAVEAVLQTRTYANLSWETVLHLANMAENNTEVSHPLLASRPAIKKAALILISSNRGMCSGYNTAVINKAKESIDKHDVPTDIVLFGKKGNAIYKSGQYHVSAEFEKSDLLDSAAEVRPLISLMVKDYLSGKYDKILVAYTDFVSSAKQVPRVKQLLPLETKTEDHYLGVVGKATHVGVSEDYLAEKAKKHLTRDDFVHDYTFEPSPSKVLDRLIPRLLEIQLYQAFLEANASEHSSRMMAMHQATEAADDMVKEFTLYYNKARQAAITNEIAEISAGANALAE
jgi:F-type H+-transporting ATPase subunit gamma